MKPAGGVEGKEHPITVKFPFRSFTSNQSSGIANNVKNTPAIPHSTIFQ